MFLSSSSLHDIKLNFVVRYSHCCSSIIFSLNETHVVIDIHFVTLTLTIPYSFSVVVCTFLPYITEDGSPTSDAQRDCAFQAQLSKNASFGVTGTASLLFSQDDT